MKTNGIPSQMKAAWNQAQTTFGAAQEVRKAIDNGGLAGGMSEGINQYCKNKGGAVAQVLAGFSNSGLGKFFLKKMLHLNFNEDGDSFEIKTNDIAEAMGQDGKLGGFLVKMIDGKSQWLSKTCSTVCKGCSKLTSSFVGKLIDKIPDVTVRDGIKDLLSQDEKSSKARSRQETKQAREEAYNEIDKQVKGIESFSDLKDQISDLEVSLTDDQKDKLYMKWAQSHTTIGEGDKEEVFDELSRKAKRNCGYEFDVEDSQKKQNRSNAVKKLFTKESSKK